MDSNTHSTQPPEPLGPRQHPEPPGSAGWPEAPAGSAGPGLLAAADQALAAEDLDRLTDTALTEETLALQELLDRLGGQWLRRLAAVDARGAAGADRGEPAASTAGWLRDRLRMGAAEARQSVRTAQALFRGPLPQTAQALTSGQISGAHARVLAQGTRQLPDHVTREAEPILVETASRLDPPRLRQAVGYLCQIADPDGADRERERRHGRRGLWLLPTFDGMVAVDGLLEPEAGRRSWRRWSRWPAPAMLRTSARVASAPPTRWPSCVVAAWRGAVAQDGWGAPAAAGHRRPP